jgi:hypothetical protein
MAISNVSISRVILLGQEKRKALCICCVESMRLFNYWKFSAVR